MSRPTREHQVAVVIDAAAERGVTLTPEQADALIERATVPDALGAVVLLNRMIGAALRKGVRRHV